MGSNADTAAPASESDATTPFEVDPFLQKGGPAPTFAQFLGALRALYRKPSDLRRFFARISEGELPTRWPKNPGMLIGRHVADDQLMQGLRYLEGDSGQRPRSKTYFLVKGHLADGTWRVTTARGHRSLAVAAAIHNLQPLAPVEAALLAYQWNGCYQSPDFSGQVTMQNLMHYLREEGVTRAWALLHRIAPRNYPDMGDAYISLRGQPRGRDRTFSVTSLHLLSRSAATSEGRIDWRKGFELGLVRRDNYRWVVRSANGQRALTLALAVHGWERGAVAKAFLAAVWGTQYQPRSEAEAVTHNVALDFLRAGHLGGVRADRIAIDPSLGNETDWRVRGRVHKKSARIFALRLLTTAEADAEGRIERSSFDLPLRWDGDHFTVVGEPTGTQARTIAGAIAAIAASGAMPSPSST